MASAQSSTRKDPIIFPLKLCPSPSKGVVVVVVVVVVVIAAAVVVVVIAAPDWTAVVT